MNYNDGEYMIPLYGIPIQIGASLDSIIRVTYSNHCHSTAADNV